MRDDAKALEQHVGASDRQRLEEFYSSVRDVERAIASLPPEYSVVVERPAEGVGVREPAPYVLVRDRLEARIARPVFYQLVDLAIESRVDGRPALGVWSDGAFFVLGASA